MCTFNRQNVKEFVKPLHFFGSVFNFFFFFKKNGKKLLKNNCGIVDYEFVSSFY